MNNHAYLEQKILSADPVELIQLLYEGAVDSIVNARTHLASGDIAQRAAAISKCMNILAELHASLDRQNGGEISRNLARLYEYMQVRLLDANVQQADGPLAEVLQLLENLAEAWRAVKNQETLQPYEAERAMPPMSGWGERYPGEASSYSAHAWSL
jgi:flagellar protein FliS